MSTNLQLLKDIINLDFAILNSSNTLKPLTENVSIYSTKKRNTLVLDFIELNKELKQLIRNLQFIKKENAPLFIYIEDKYLFKIVEQFFKNKKIENKIVLNSSVSSFNVEANSFNSILILGSTDLNRRKSMFFNFFFVHKINFDVEKNCSGFYKMSNKIDSLSKTIFLLCILTRILKID